MNEKGFEKYQSGQVTAGGELNDSLSRVGDVFEDWKGGRANYYPDLFGEIYFQKLPKWVAVEITPEQEHLCRPTELKSGITKTITHAWGRYDGN